MPLPADQLQLLTYTLVTASRGFCVGRKKNVWDQDEKCPDSNCLDAIGAFEQYIGVVNGVYNSNKKTMVDIKRYFAARGKGSFYEISMKDKWLFGNTIRLTSYMDGVIYIWSEGLKVNSVLDEKSQSEIEQLREQVRKLGEEVEKASRAPSIFERASLSGFDTASLRGMPAASEAKKDDDLKSLIQQIFSPKGVAIYLDILREFHDLPSNRPQEKNALAMVSWSFLDSLTSSVASKTTNTDTFLQSLLSSTSNQWAVKKIRDIQAVHSEKNDVAPIIEERHVKGIKFALEKKPLILPNKELRKKYSEAFRSAYPAASNNKSSSQAASRNASKHSSPVRSSMVPTEATLSSISGSAPPQAPAVAAVQVQKIPLVATTNSGGLASAAVTAAIPIVFAAAPAAQPS